MNAVECAFASIQAEYNFANFSIDSFKAYIEQRRGREIVLMPRPFGTVSFTGIWFPRPQFDYVCYASDIHPIHQEHSIIHEFAHILFNHQPASLDDMTQVLLFRDTSTVLSAEELEAEAFARLVMPFVLATRRQNQFKSEYE